jgi:hypothetical protein
VSEDPEIPEALLRVFALGTRMTWRDAWGLLTPDERTFALVSILQSRKTDDRKAFTRYKELLAAELLSHRRGFRSSTIVSWPVERLAKEVAQLRAPERVSVVKDVLQEHHLPAFPTVQGAFFDRLGIPHEAGVATIDLEEAEWSDAQLHEAVLGLWAEQPSMLTGTYLVSLATAWRSQWGGIAESLAGIARDGGANAGKSTSGVGSPSTIVLDYLTDVAREADGLLERPHQTLGLESPPHPAEIRATESSEPRSSGHINAEQAVLSALDEELIRRTVASTQGELGAPDEATMDGIIDEFVSLNALRAQSLFHLGFHDGLRARAARAALPAADVSRWRWYFAGFIDALSRRGRLDEIPDVFNSSEIVQGLVDTGTGPAFRAAHLIVRGLIASGETPDLFHCVKPRAIVDHPHVADLLLEHATSLQREERHDDASAIFEMLHASLLEVGGGSDRGRWETIQRRFAHCLRIGGKHVAARTMLEGLIESEDALARAMVLTDIGLLDAGYGRLADLRLPWGREGRERMVQGLEQGMARFREADAIQVQTSSHAHYAMGMLALVRKQYGEAESLIESAVGAFDLEPQRYEPGGLLRRARMHLAVARCANLDTIVARLPDAVTAIVNGLAEEERLPDQYIADVVAALNLRGTRSAQEAIDRLLHVGGDAALDELRASTDERASVAVAEALLERFRRPHRVAGERAADGRAALLMLLSNARAEEASAVFDGLEELALDGVDEPQMLDLLDDPRLTSILETWDIRNVRVRLLEAAGRYDDAAGILASEFRRVIATPTPWARQEALDLLETIRSYSPCHAVSWEDLQRRLDALALPEDVLPSSTPSRAVRVLVVGGNETQAQYDAEIVAHYRECAPWLEVEFLHSGWTSNWDRHLEDFKRRAQRMDALVLLKLMRTEFGRAVRREWTKAWRGCGGRGRESIQRAIDAAAAAAVDARGD